MNLRFFIDRPVFSGVISVVIVLMGLIAIKVLPVEQYPDIAPPTVNVFCTYPGANAETVQKAVIVPLEEAINGVEDMIYMTSTASNTGDASINIYFKQGANADMAAVNVQNRVNGALSQLPAEATKSGVTTEKQQNAELMTFALYSPDDRFDQTFLNNYMKINVEPRVKRIGGVGKAQLFGSNYSMRLWLKPDKMAGYGLIPDDISAVLARQNIEAATGSFGQNSDGANEYTMKYRGRLSTAEEFGELVVKSLPGGDVLRLKEVADIELGDEYYNYSSEVNGHPAAMMMINQKSGSNASSTINEIHEVLDDLSRDLPEGAEFVVLTDTNKFLNASIHSVIRTAYRGDTFSHRGGVCVLTGHQVHADSHDFYLRVHHRNVCRNVTDRLFHQPAYAFRPCACHRHGGGRCHRGGGSRAGEVRRGVSVSGACRR